ncbi:gluconokinase [Vagococcus elongatus]|nr:FGGY family carbohydrate kinase [Vagococcus elongatus]
MDNHDVFLSIDVGTTSVKFGVIQTHEIIWEKAIQLATYTEENAARFQLRSEILEVVFRGIREIPSALRKKIKMIGFSVAMHSCFPFDKDHQERVFLWSDAQASEAIEAFKQTEKATAFYLKTGTPIHPMTPFAKIMHFQKTQEFSPETKWYGLKELLLHMFTGRHLIDFSTASATGLFNLLERCWDQEILNYLGINETQLGKLVDTTATFNIQRKTAVELGLSEDVKILAGASDGCLATYAGYKTTGIPHSLTVGTSAALRKISHKPVLDFKQQNFCYYLQEDMYVVGAPSNNGGNVLEWAAQLFSDKPEDFFEQLETIGKRSPLGANGIRFFPYVFGERAPFWDMTMQASFKNLTATHRKEDIIRGIAEGIIMNLRLLKCMLNPVQIVTINGGFFQNIFLKQLTADILDVECLLTDKNEPIYGLYALVAATPKPQHNTEKITRPNVKQSIAYQKLAETYFED